MLSTRTYTFPSLQRIGTQGVLLAITIAAAGLIGLSTSQEHWFLLAALALVALVVLRPVYVALGIFAFLVPFDSITVVGQGASGTSISWYIGAAAAPILLLIGLAAGRLRSPSSASRLWILFLAWSAITTFWAIEPNDSLLRLPTALAFLIFYFVSASFRIKKKEFEAIVAMTILGGVAAAGLILYQFHQGIFYEGSGQTLRGSLSWGDRETNPNTIVASLLPATSFCISWLFRVRGWLGRVFVAALITATVSAIMVTMSRGGLVALFAVIAVYCYRSGVNWRLIAIIVVLAVSLSFMPSLFFMRLEEAYSTGGSGRLYIWAAGLVALRHYGLIGAGLNNFQAAYTQYAGYASHFMGFGRDPHNVFLSIAVESGILGIVLFLGAIRRQLREVTKVCALSPMPNHSIIACEAACWGLLTGGLFSNVLWSKAFWFSWVVLVFATQLGKTSNNPTDLEIMSQKRYSR